MNSNQNPEIDNPQEQSYALAQMRIESLRNNLHNIRETRITPELISSLFHSAKSVGEDVMGLNPVAATVFSMGFGCFSLTSATTVGIEETHHIHNGTEKFTTEVPLNTPSDIAKTVSRYIQNHFNRNAEFRSHQQVFREAQNKFVSAGIPSDYLDNIWEVGTDVASDLCPPDEDRIKGIDESKFTIAYFKEMAKKVPEKPSFVMHEDTYPEFMRETEEWLHGRFEEVINNVMSGEYLREQEMS